MAHRRFGLCLTVSAVLHCGLLAIIAAMEPPLTALRMRLTPPSTPIVVTLLPAHPLNNPHAPQPPSHRATLLPHHSTPAPRVHRAGGAPSRRLRSPKPVRRTLPLPAPVQPKLAMAPHPRAAAPALIRTPPPPPIDTTVIHKTANEDTSVPQVIPPPVQSAKTDQPVPDSTASGSKAPAGLTGPQSAGGGMESGSPTGVAVGSGTGEKGAGNGTGPGHGLGTGSGSGPFGIDAGPGEGPRHIVYVVDESGSMTSRIDTTRNEISSALGTLTPNESFNLIAFSTDTRIFDPGRMDPADPDNIALAKTWLSYQHPDGGTNLQDALTLAMQMPGVNVVVLITDGVPTRGETNFDKIARNIRKRNRNGVKIYTIGLIGKNPDGTDDTFEAARLLQRLAADSGGTCKFVSLGVATPE